MAKSLDRARSGETVHYEPPRKTRGPGRRTIQPPLTPMIDVTFQLLLFFLVACEFRETEGLIPGTLPIGDVRQVIVVELPDPIQIRLRPSADRESANYEVTGVAVVITNPEELFTELKVRQTELQTRDVPVVILPAPDVPWNFVVEAFNQAVRAKFAKIGFAREIY